MGIYNFLLGLLIWAGVGCILATLIYGVAYCASKVGGFQIRKPLSLFFLIIFCCVLSYILQVVAREFGFAQSLQNYRTIFTIVNIIVFIIFFGFLAKKQYKKGNK